AGSRRPGAGAAPRARRRRARPGHRAPPPARLDELAAGGPVALTASLRDGPRRGGVRVSLERYLTGEATGDERRRVEEELFADDGALERLALAEDDLVDACARGQLSA